MTCKRCKGPTSVYRTYGKKTVIRERRCSKCSEQWETQERETGGTRVRYGDAICSAPVSQSASSPQVSDPPSLSIIALVPDQTHARKSMPNADVFPVVGDPDNPVWSITAEEFQTLLDAFPDLDVGQESKRALSWVKSNKAHRKTAGGMMRFLNGWMARNQNRGGARNGVHRGGHAPAEVKDRPSGEVKL